jgi:CreA protein
VIEGSPENSTSSVPIMPWGANDQIQKCADWIQK